MSQEEVLRLVARARDDASPALRKIRENLAAVKEGSAGPRDATRHLKLMHEEAARGSTELKRQYRELREHIGKVTTGITEGLEPAFAGLGIKTLAATGAVAGLVTMLRGVAERGADLEAFARKARLSMDTVRGMEGVASIFRVDPAQIRANEQAFTDAMYAFRRHRGDFYTFLRAQRPKDAAALAITPETTEGNEKALHLYLEMLDRIRRERGGNEAAVRLFSKQALGDDSFVDMLKNGVGGLEEAIKRYNDAAGKVDPKASDDFVRNLNDFKAALDGLQTSAGNALLPDLTKGVHALAGAMKEWGPTLTDDVIKGIHDFRDGVTEAWPKIKHEFEELDPYVQKVGGWKAVFEGLAAIKLVSFTAEVSGLASAVRVLASGIGMLPAGARGVLGLAGAAAAGASAESTPGAGISADPGERQKQVEENRRLTDDANRRLRQGPYAPSDAETHQQFQKDRQNFGGSMFHRSSFAGDGLVAAHSEFEEAVARGTAAGVVKGLSDFSGMKAMDAAGGGGGISNASYTTYGSGGGGRRGSTGGLSSGGLGANPYGGLKDSASLREHVDFIRKAAASQGIDPDHALRVARSEGLGRAYGTGDRGTSFGDFQMHYKNNIRGLSLGGLGDLFNKQTGLDGRDPKNWKALDLFALKMMRRQGNTPWHGYRGGRWDGIGPMPQGNPLPDVSPTPLPAPGEMSRKSHESLSMVHRVHGTGELNVRVQAPRGTDVRAGGTGLFKEVRLNRGYSMTEASELS